MQIVDGWLEVDFAAVLAPGEKIDTLELLPIAKALLAARASS